MAIFAWWPQRGQYCSFVSWPSRQAGRQGSKSLNNLADGLASSSRQIDRDKLLVAFYYHRCRLCHNYFIARRGFSANKKSKGKSTGTVFCNGASFVYFFTNFNFFPRLVVAVAAADVDADAVDFNFRLFIYWISSEHNSQLTATISSRPSNLQDRKKSLTG